MNWVVVSQQADPETDTTHPGASLFYWEVIMKKSTASTGPRSAEGKARSSMNALKSGIYSKSLTIPGEDPAQLTALTDEYYQRFHPAYPEQRDQVDILIRSTWTLRRLAAAEAQVWEYQMENMTGAAKLGHAFRSAGDAFGRLQRIVNSTQRNYRDALHELERIQSLPLGTCPDPPTAQPPQPQPQPIATEPVTPPNQFVSSTSPQPRRAFGPPVPKEPEKPLPFHLPGSNCYFEPAEPTVHKQCPFCFPPK
jgi:hypothetical protein